MKRRLKTDPPKDWPMSTFLPISTDPLGSYTGIPEDPADKPVQDADDL